MSSDSSTLERGKGGRIEPEQLAGVSAPADEDAEVYGHGIDDIGEETTEGVMEAVRALNNDDDDN